MCETMHVLIIFQFSSELSTIGQKYPTFPFGRDADRCPIIPFDEMRTWMLALGEKSGAWFTSADTSTDGQEREITLNGNPLASLKCRLEISRAEYLRRFQAHE